MIDRARILNTLFLASRNENGVRQVCIYSVRSMVSLAYHTTVITATRVKVVIGCSKTSLQTKHFGEFNDKFPVKNYELTDLEYFLIVACINVTSSII